MLFLCVLVPFLPVSATGVMNSITGNSTISNQLDAGSIIVSHIKSICEPSLPLRVYGPMRLTHNASQGVMTTSLAGSLPYFNFRRLLIWQARHFLTYDRIVVRILFQYIAALRVSSRREWPGCCCWNSPQRLHQERPIAPTTTTDRHISHVPKTYVRGLEPTICRSRTTSECTTAINYPTAIATTSN